MSSTLSGIEAKIDQVVKDAPFQIPEKSRRSIANNMSWISLLIGVLSLWGAYALWNLAHVASRVIDFGNSLSQLYGTAAPVPKSHLTVFVWIGIILLAVEGVIYLMAYPGLKAKTKAGWNLLFYGALVNLAYGIIMLFDSYSGGVGRLIATLVSSAVGLYFLFQIRSYFIGKTTNSPTK